MATYNQVRNGTNNQKKGISSSVAVIDFDAQPVASGETVAVFNLPGNSVITAAFFRVIEGVTGATATGKISVGGTDAIAAVAFAGVAEAVKGGATTKISTGTGAEVLVTIGTANATAGKVEAVVTYIENSKSTGELTNI